MLCKLPHVSACKGKLPPIVIMHFAAQSPAQERCVCSSRGGGVGGRPGMLVAAHDNH